MIAELARRLGIENRYTDFYGHAHDVPRSTLLAIVRAMGYPIESDADASEASRRLQEAERGVQPVYVMRASAPSRIEVGGETLEFGESLEPGYHDVTIAGERTTVIAVPDTAYLPAQLQERKAWGFAAQLYSLRSERNWGIGDFHDLERLCTLGRDVGAGTIAVNPLHQLHLTNPTSASPYSPNSRLFLNALYIDAPGAAAYLGAQRLLANRIDVAAIDALRDSELVDYRSVARVKLAALRALHGALRRRSGARPAEFEAFVERGGHALRSLALYEAIMEYQKRRNDDAYGWLQWPEELRDPASPAVDEFARAHRRDVEFYAFLQWLADTQLSRAANAAHGMPIGLYRDLAVGVDANSADVWSDRGAYCLGVCVGAPPDPMNPHGQNWALPPLDPHVLRARAYAPYIALLRANMRHAGALRIDHVMGLMRLFCIPAGTSAAEGTYVNYRFDEMLGILALESQRNRCMIVGEDLGTVPDGFRERLSSARIFGCRLLYFEREGDGRFRAPEAYEPYAVASPGTHDVAPMAGFWAGTDLAQRARLGFFTAEQSADAAYADRSYARKSLLEILVSRGFLGMDDATRLENEQDPPADLLSALVVAAYKLLGHSASRLLLVQLEDALLQREQVNTPGTFDEVPNWRRRLPETLESMACDARLTGLARAVGEARSIGS